MHWLFWIEPQIVFLLFVMRMSSTWSLTILRLWCRHMGQGAGERENSVWSMKVKVLVAQSCRILCHPMDCSPPGSSVYGILQARILEWVAIPFSLGSSQPRDQTWVSCIAGRFLTIWATCIYMYVGFPGGTVVKSLPASAGDTRDLSEIPGSGRSPGEGNDNSFQYSCLRNFMDRRAWWATVHGVAKSRTRLSTYTYTHVCM